MDFQLDTDGDIEIDSNDLILVDGIDAIKQSVQMRLKTFLGEEFSDDEVGVPWFTDILIKNPSFLVVGEIIKKKILETRGVTDIISFVFDIDGRTATLDFEALTVNGFINFSESIGI